MFDPTYMLAHPNERAYPTSLTEPGMLAYYDETFALLGKDSGNPVNQAPFSVFPHLDTLSGFLQNRSKLPGYSPDQARRMLDIGLVTALTGLTDTAINRIFVERELPRRAEIPNLVPRPIILAMTTAMMTNLSEQLGWLNVFDRIDCAMHPLLSAWLVQGNDPISGDPLFPGLRKRDVLATALHHYDPTSQCLETNYPAPNRANQHRYTDSTHLIIPDQAGTNAVQNLLASTPEHDTVVALTAVTNYLTSPFVKPSPRLIEMQRDPHNVSVVALKNIERQPEATDRIGPRIGQIGARLIALEEQYNISVFKTATRKRFLELLMISGGDQIDKETFYNIVNVSLGKTAPIGRLPSDLAKRRFATQHLPPAV